jgi:hypothetical protein
MFNILRQINYIMLMIVEQILIYQVLGQVVLGVSPKLIVQMAIQ